MKNAHDVEEVSEHRQVQIDGETWQELTRLFEQVVDTLGTIAPVLDLASNKKDEKEKLRHNRAVADLASRGHRALKAFCQRWALVEEESRKRPVVEGAEDFGDIFQAARQLPSTDLSPGSKSGIAEAPRVLG
jgi:hypothetical protein